MEGSVVWTKTDSSPTSGTKHGKKNDTSDQVSAATAQPTSYVWTYHPRVEPRYGHNPLHSSFCPWILASSMHAPFCLLAVLSTAEKKVPLKCIGDNGKGGRCTPSSCCSLPLDGREQQRDPACPL